MISRDSQDVTIVHQNRDMYDATDRTKEVGRVLLDCHSCHFTTNIFLFTNVMD
jgi:hypothetical protein